MTGTVAGSGADVGVPSGTLGLGFRLRSINRFSLLAKWSDLGACVQSPIPKSLASITRSSNSSSVICGAVAWQGMEPKCAYCYQTFFDKWGDVLRPRKMVMIVNYDDPKLSYRPKPIFQVMRCLSTSPPSETNRHSLRRLRMPWGCCGRGA